MSQKIRFKIIRSDELSVPKEPRYVVVDEQDEIIDVAQGYGYRSWKRAYRCYTFKCGKNHKDYEYIKD